MIGTRGVNTDTFLLFFSRSKWVETGFEMEKEAGCQSVFLWRFGYEWFVSAFDVSKGKRSERQLRVREGGVLSDGSACFFGSCGA